MTAKRSFTRSMKSFAHYEGDLGRIVAETIRRVRHIRRTMKCGAFLLLDPEGFAYLLPDSAVADKMMAKYFSWMVGCYTTPSARVLREDLLEIIGQRGLKIP